MRFASIGGSNAASYAGAGKAVADSAAAMFKKQRETGPDYTGLSKVAMKTASDERQVATLAEAKLTERAIGQYGRNTQSAIKVAVFNKGQELKQKARKAGGIAAIGKMAGAGFLAATDNTKGRERPKSDLQGVYSDWEEGYKDLKDRQKSERDGLGEFTSTPYEPTTGDGSGKVTGGNDSPSISASGTGMSEGWSKWSKVIKAGEGTTGDKGYTTMFTGRQFTDLSKHPSVINRSGRHASDAAGAYQFLSTTWNPAAKALGVTDFSPASQEKVGKYLAQKRGLAADTVFTDKASFLKELDKIAPEWASMPTLSTGTSYYGQGGLTPDQAWNLYNN